MFIILRGRLFIWLRASIRCLECGGTRVSMLCYIRLQQHQKITCIVGAGGDFLPPSEIQASLRALSGFLFGSCYLSQHPLPRLNAGAADLFAHPVQIDAARINLGRVRTEKIDGPLSAISGMRLLSGRSKRTLPDLAVLT